MFIILVGEARSGKDTVGGILAKEFGAACIAQADPMKRFVQRAFRLSSETLWGPSQERDKLVRDNAGSMDIWWKEAEMAFHDAAKALLDEVLPDIAAFRLQRVANQLQDWFDHVRSSYESDISARILLQTVGTEWGRAVSPRMWNEWALKAGRQLMEGGVVYEREKGLVHEPSQPGFPCTAITDGRFRNEVLGTREKGGYAIQVFDPKAEARTVGVAGHRSESEQRAIPRHWFNAVIQNDKTHGLNALECAVQSTMRALFGATNVEMTRTYK